MHFGGVWSRVSTPWYPEHDAGVLTATPRCSVRGTLLYLYGLKWKYVKNLNEVPEVVYELKHEDTCLVRTEREKIIYDSTWTISVSYFVTYVTCLYMISLFKEIVHVSPCHLVTWRYRLWRPSELFAAIVPLLHARRVKGIMK
jgi:hypothetical protein